MRQPRRRCAWSGESVFIHGTPRPHCVRRRRSASIPRAHSRPTGGPVPPQTTLLLDRGPYTLDGERALLRERGVGLLVTKNSGGSMTAAKLQAARELSVLVVMVQRPPLPEGSEVVATVDDALTWITRSGSGAG